MILERQSNKSSIISRNANEKGMVLIGTLAILAIIFLLAGMAVTSTFTEIRISSNYKSSKQAFYIAEAGVQRAKAELKTVKFNDILDGTYSGSPGILSFGVNTEFPEESPIGTYNVVVQDDYDGNPDTVKIKGTGFKNGSKSSVEILIEKTVIPFPPIPAAITIIGEANTWISDSNNIRVDGRDWKLTDITGPTGTDPARYAIALSNIGTGGSSQDPIQAIAGLDSDILAGQVPNFVGKLAGYPESIGLDNSMTSQNLQDFIDLAKQVADNSLMVSDVPDGLGTTEFGSVDNPKITYINMKPEDNEGVTNNVVFGSDITGSGILIVEGNDLIFEKSLNWIGVVVVIGNDTGGGFLGYGSVEQTIRGAFIVDEQNSDSDNELVLTGNMKIRYSSDAVDLAQRLVFEKGAGNITVLTWGDSRLLE